MTQAGPFFNDRTKKSNSLSNPGPYVATIMNNLDPTCMGRIQVWIPELSSMPAPDQSGWITVSYATPFYGVTNLTAKSSADITSTSQSYGMWFVPPDIGVQVLVMFANLDLARGFWFACVPSQLLNHMIPGIAQRSATNTASPDRDPITEYNKKTVGSFTKQAEVFSDPTKAPPHLIQTAILEQQGLAQDEARGPTTSTVRREAPSSVFGISTPGRILTRAAPTPEAGSTEFLTVTGRTGGHQFVMDDGDALGQNQGIRIRSSSGGMVLINDTIGSVYVINQNGSAWVEMTANGRIDVYGKGSVSVHSEKDLNLTANNDVNILATKNFNVVAANINTEAVEQRHYAKAKFYQRSPDMMMESDSLTLIAKPKSGGGETTSAYGSGLTVQAQQGSMEFDTLFKMSAGDNITFKTNTKFQVHAQGVITLKSDGKLELDAIGGMWEAAKAGTGTIASFTQKVDDDFTGGDNDGDVHPVTGWTASKNWYEGDSTPIEFAPVVPRTTGVVDIPKPFNSGIQQSHVPITPQHEPWTDHEISVSTSASSAPTGTKTGDALFSNGAGVAFPADTTNIVSGSKAFALSETLAQFMSDMAINFDTYREDVAATSSRGRYSTMPNGDPMINPNGYIGRYQLGMSLLKGLGVTTSDSQSKDAVLTASNWTPSTQELLCPRFGNAAIFSPPSTPQLGAGSANNFLLDTALQDKCLIASTYSNYLSLKALGIITGAADETNADRAGWLKAVMFMGLGNKQGFSKFAPGMQLTAEDVRKLTTDSNNLGNGAIGLYVHWKILKKSPAAHVFKDASGTTAYGYFAQGSKTQVD